MLWDRLSKVFVIQVYNYNISPGIYCLRTVPTIVIAHTFYANRDTRISYGWCLLIQGYFCAVQNYTEKANLSIALGIQKEN